MIHNNTRTNIARRFSRFLPKALLLFMLLMPAASPVQAKPDAFGRLNAQAARVRQKMLKQATREREIWLLIVLALIMLGIGLNLLRYFARRKYQRQLLQQNRELELALSRAEESDRMKTSFIEHVSHEIRTPLNVITGYAQIISSPFYELEEHERDRLIKEISRNTIEITNIVNELLEVAQSDSRERYAKEDTINVNRLCLDIIHDTSTAQEAHISIDFKSLLDDDFTMRSNAAAIEKILGQLLKNALKFTPDDGSIELKVRERAAHGGIEFAVTDTGIGIAEEHQKHVFEQFYKVDAFKQGLGLGLTMALKIAERLGGTITLDEHYKRGARFVLILPN